MSVNIALILLKNCYAKFALPKKQALDFLVGKRILAHLFYVILMWPFSGSSEEVAVRIFTYHTPPRLVIKPTCANFLLQTSSTRFRLTASDSIVITAVNNTLWYNFGQGNTAADSIFLTPDAPGEPIVVLADSRQHLYRGRLLVWADQSTPVVVNRLEMDSYLKGVLSTEMEASAPIEALKAQAIVSRSYARFNIGRHITDGFDFCDLTHCQVYHGQSAETPPTNRAVDGTRGEILTYRGLVVEAFFSSVCGGLTATPLELWGFESPMQPVQDDLCRRSPHFAWQYSLSAEEMLRILQADARTNPGRNLADVKVAGYGPSHRAMEIEIRGEQSQRVSGFTFWSVLAAGLKWGKIKSTRFNIRHRSDQYIFDGFGFGHGVGLCQNGAIARAYRGDSYQQILTHYFPRLQAR